LYLLWQILTHPWLSAIFLYSFLSALIGKEERALAVIHRYGHRRFPFFCNALALLLCHVNRERVGIEFLRTQIAVPNAWPRVCSFLISACARAGRTDEALDTCDRLAHHESGNVVARAEYARGCVLLELERPAEALLAFRRSLSHSGNLAHIRYGLAVSSYHLGRYEDYENELAETLRLDPSFRMSPESKALAEKTLRKQRAGAENQGVEEPNPLP